MGVVSLIVMEPGSEWPGHVGDTENIVAAGSGGAALLQRTRRTVDLLRARSQCVRVAVLACCEQADLESARYRSEIATQLLIAIAPAALGRLFLCTGDRPSLRLRHELLSLAGVLCHELRGTTSAVGVIDRHIDRRMSGDGEAPRGDWRAPGSGSVPSRVAGLMISREPRRPLGHLRSQLAVVRALTDQVEHVSRLEDDGASSGPVSSKSSPDWGAGSWTKPAHWPPRRRARTAASSREVRRSPLDEPAAAATLPSPFLRRRG